MIAEATRELTNAGSIGAEIVTVAEIVRLHTHILLHTDLIYCTFS